MLGRNYLGNWQFSISLCLMIVLMHGWLLDVGKNGLYTQSRISPSSTSAYRCAPCYQASEGEFNRVSTVDADLWRMSSCLNSSLLHTIFILAGYSVSSWCHTRVIVPVQSDRWVHLITILSLERERERKKGKWWKWSLLEGARASSNRVEPSTSLICYNSHKNLFMDCGFWRMNPGSE